MAIDRPLVLLWIPDAAPYCQGLARAGLDQRVDVVPLGETPKPELLARCEAIQGPDDRGRGALQRFLTGQPLRETVARARGY